MDPPLPARIFLFSLPWAFQASTRKLYPIPFPHKHSVCSCLCVIGHCQCFLGSTVSQKEHVLEDPGVAVLELGRL